MLQVCLLTLLLTQSASKFAGALPADAPARAPLATDTALATGPAGCLVQVGHRVLMVRDIWSRRFGLPGGGHDAGETGPQTAARETFEETGLRVTPGEQVYTTPSNFTVYRCTPDDGVPVHPDGTVVLPKAGFDELIEARLVDPSAVPDAQLRFVSQRAALTQAVAQFAGLPESVLRPPPPRSRLFTDELPAIRAVQAGVARIFASQGDAVMRALSQLGSTAAVLAVIVAVWFAVGWRAGAELAYVLLLTCLVGLMGKEFFGWPRPFHVAPELQRDAASSFGFPSGHTICAAALWGCVAVHTRRMVLPCTLLVLACALSRVALGVHYIHDVVAGGLFGAVACAAYRAHLAYYRCTRVPLATWYVASLILGIAALCYHPQPPTVAVCGLLLGFGAGSRALQRRTPAPPAAQVRWTCHPAAAQRCLYAAAAIAIAVFVLYIMPFTVPPESSFHAQLYAHVGTYLLLGYLLPAVELKVSRRALF